MCLKKTKIEKIRLTKIIKGISRNTAVDWTVTGLITAERPRINAMFAMLDPTTFPIEIALLPFNAAWILTTSSGLLVPKATTVSPTTKGVKPTLIAKEDDPLTRSSPPTNNNINPKKSNKNISKIILEYLFNDIF